MVGFCHSNSRNVQRVDRSETWAQQLIEFHGVVLSEVKNDLQKETVVFHPFISTLQLFSYTCYHLGCTAVSCCCYSFLKNKWAVDDTHSHTSIQVKWLFAHCPQLILISWILCLWLIRVLNFTHPLFNVFHPGFENAFCTINGFTALMGLSRSTGNKRLWHDFDKWSKLLFHQALSYKRNMSFHVIWKIFWYATCFEI